MSSVKSELSPARHTICTLEGEISMNNCAKRRRSPLLASVNPEQQTHATSLVGQPDATPATTTTVKRCSKFRGFSRHHHNGRCEARAGRVSRNKYIYLDTEFSFNTNPFKTEIAWGIPQKQACIKQKMQSYPSNKSSQTALGILLRSSMFRDMVAKNMHDETEENERKKLKLQSDEDKQKIAV